MLSAQAQSVSLKPSRLGRLWRALGRFFHRFVRIGLRRVPALPDDLHGDVGLGESLPASRSDAFWEAKRRSGARDLPL